MTIKEISIKKGITTQSVYKKIRRAGFEIDKLTTGKNGQLTSDAEDLLRELFGLPIEGDPAGEPGASDPGGQEIEPQSQGESKPGEGYNQGERVITQLREQLEKLTTRVTTLEEQNIKLKEERDFLRRSLEREQQAVERAQQLQAIATAKIPNPVPALPKPSEKGGLFGWMRRRSSKEE